jgi:soluble lytic murein transglycosylase
MRQSRPRLWPLSLGAISLACAALSPPRATAPAQAADAIHSAGFDPDVVRPAHASLFATVLNARATGNLEAARTLSTSALRTASTDEEPLYRWIAAESARAQDAIDEAAALMLPLALSQHPLAPYARLHLADWLEAKDPGRALALLDNLLVATSELETFAAKGQAERLRAKVLARVGRADEAIATFEHLLQASADDSTTLQLMVPLSELLATRGEDERVRALELCRRMIHRAPGTRVAKRAEELAASLRPGIPEARRIAAEQVAIEDELVRADLLLQQMKISEARETYLRVAARVPEGPIACRARFGVARALLDSQKRTEGAQAMVEVAERCTHDVDQRAWAHFHAARAYGALGMNAEAIAQYEALERDVPGHRLADDALFRSARIARDMGDEAGFLSRLALVPQRYPAGDMLARARFTLALAQFESGAKAQAVATLSADLRDEVAEDLAGRASYFRGRFLEESGLRHEAVEAFAATAERVPLAYFGQLAYARLAALDAARAERLASADNHRSADKLAFEVEPALLRPGFQRAVALLRAGEVTLGAAELRSAGISDGRLGRHLVWVAVALLDRVGSPQLSLDLSRKFAPDLLARQPRGRDLSLYRLVYPRAYDPLCETSAAREGVPAAFVRAVAREESGFYPKAVSRARAYGLLQVLPTTAKEIARAGLKVPYNIRALEDPAINLAIGARFIRTLTDSFGGQLALVPPAYNAGPGATARWLRERGTEPLDLWVEHIPYDETRGYTRRVLQTYGVYHWLETGQRTRLPLKLPGTGS